MEQSSENHQAIIIAETFSFSFVWLYKTVFGSIKSNGNRKPGYPPAPDNSDRLRYSGFLLNGTYYIIGLGPVLECVFFKRETTRKVRARCNTFFVLMGPKKAFWSPFMLISFQLGI